jgi:hypothetical protein
LGNPALLTAFTFAAYVVGSLLSFRLISAYVFYILPDKEVLKQATGYSIFLYKLGLVFRRVAFIEGSRYSLYRQLETFVGKRLRQVGVYFSMDSGDFRLREMDEILLPRMQRRQFGDELFSPTLATSSFSDRKLTSKYVPEFVKAIVEELEFVGIQLQDANRDLWDTFDRKDAESEFRSAISLPLAVILAVFSIQASPLWLSLLVVPGALLILSVRLRAQTTAILVQAIVLRAGEPPVLAELGEIEKWAKKPGPDHARRQLGDNENDPAVSPRISGVD